MKRTEEAWQAFVLSYNMSDMMPGAGSSEMHYACSPAPSIPGMSTVRKFLEKENTL